MASGISPLLCAQSHKIPESAPVVAARSKDAQQLFKASQISFIYRAHMANFGKYMHSHHVLDAGNHHWSRGSWVMNEDDSLNLEESCEHISLEQEPSRNIATPFPNCDDVGVFPKTLADLSWEESRQMGAARFVQISTAKGL